MNSKIKQERRQFLSRFSTVVGTGIGLSLLGQRAAAQATRSCALTPSQPLGPFLPTGREPLKGFTKDSDLTVIEGGTGLARGEIIEVEGMVTDTQCLPVAGAMVEIWQACASGRYNHENDPNPAPLDENFQYSGKVITGADGRYSFRTIKPGSYPADTNWVRPPHIHFRAMKRGYLDLITQMYFAGEALNASDLILRQLSALEQGEVVVALVTPPTSPGIKSASFNLTLRKPGERPGI